MGCVWGENGRWSRTVTCGQVAKRLCCPGEVQVYSASDGALLGIFGVQNVRIRAALKRDALGSRGVVQDSSWVERCGEKLEVREEAILVCREPGLDLEARAVTVNPGGSSQGGRATLLERPSF